MSVEALQYSEGKTSTLLKYLRASFASNTEPPLLQISSKQEYTTLKLIWITLESNFTSNSGLEKRNVSGLYLRERRSTNMFRIPSRREKESLSSEILYSVIPVPLKPFSPFAVPSSRLQRLDNSTVRTYSCWQATQRRQHWLAVSSSPWRTENKAPKKNGTYIDS